jgi:DNA-binding MarR family transcriptional regulator
MIRRAETQLETWMSFLRVDAAITRRLNADLFQAHRLTLTDYEVLLLLSTADRGMMRRVDLAESVSLSASGMTRLLHGLERGGLVERASCNADARVSAAKLTPAGAGKLREASKTYLAAMEDVFSSGLDDGELELLETLLARLSGAADRWRIQ